MATPFPFGSGNVLTAAQMNAITTLPINDQTASYVALVGDVGKRIVMNVATANTITINNSVFGVGDEIFIANKGAGSTTITAGAGVTINTASSLVLAQHGGGTLVALSASVFTFFSQQAATYGVATGGTSSSITVSSVNYTLLSFTSDSNLVVSKSGLFDVLLVAGGGGAGFESGTSCGGGGGAGGLLQTTIFAAAGTYAVTVGAGGAGQVEGLGSQIASLVSCAGGGANRQTSTANEPATPGGSGAGAGVGTSTSGAVAIAGSLQGNAGGNKGLATSAGGGGGKGAVGAAGSGTTGGAGGAGFDVSVFISGSALFKAGGGGGAGSVTGGAGGSSIGGAGSSGSNAGANAAANTGSGGGGGGTSGGTGGSGIVYVRFKV